MNLRGISFEVPLYLRCPLEGMFQSQCGTALVPMWDRFGPSVGTFASKPLRVLPFNLRIFDKSLILEDLTNSRRKHLHR